jgi:hypothetical protein
LNIFESENHADDDSCRFGSKSSERTASHSSHVPQSYNNFSLATQQIFSFLSRLNNACDDDKDDG